MIETIDKETRWHLKWLRKAIATARDCSKDPNTQVGAVIVQGDIAISEGWNGLPRGMADTRERLHDREWKMGCVVHAEVNALLNISRHGGYGALNGTMYCVATDETGEAWGGPPCKLCTPSVIQGGVRRVITPMRRSRPSKYHADMPMCIEWLQEGGVQFIELDAQLTHLIADPLARITYLGTEK